MAPCCGLGNTPVAEAPARSSGEDGGNNIFLSRLSTDGWSLFACGLADEDRKPPLVLARGGMATCGSGADDPRRSAVVFAGESIACSSLVAGGLADEDRNAALDFAKGGMLTWASCGDGPCVGGGATARSGVESPRCSASAPGNNSDG